MKTKRKKTKHVKKKRRYIPIVGHLSIRPDYTREFSSSQTVGWFAARPTAHAKWTVGSKAAAAVIAVAVAVVAVAVVAAVVVGVVVV